MTTNVFSELQFLCPHTARVIESGVQTDSRTRARVNNNTIHLVCPHCGMEHDLIVRDAQSADTLRLAG